MEQYLIVIEKGGDNYCAYSPDVPGCVATGKTIEKTLRSMREALVMHLEGTAEDGDELPRAKGLAYYVAQDEPIAEPGDLLTLISIPLPVPV